METNNPGTEPVSAPVTVAPQVIMPRNKTVERQGSRSEPYTARHPQVRGGVCDFCGTIDQNVAAEHQYKLCPHYRGMQLRCSYCDDNKDPNDVVYHAVLNVADHPTNPQSLVVWCDSYECSRSHEKRWKLNA